ncbi:MAG: 16S rRNA (guanine(527)-N(7))-methyltransferase RsmG [Ruminococcaceae bacterium]|nr:16S rRNA (guanine(527)-N(7))-methyltransferase RsmG [Oscillospiraceae bacterium]
MKETLLAGLPALKLTLPEDRIDRLTAFGEAVIRQNAVMNLTAITEPKQVARLHLLDSLSLLSLEDLSGKKMIDVGCGAGFPGVPVKIACPEVQLTLLDSLGKRMNWLSEVLPTVRVEAECVTARAEEFVTQRRESYDIATSRAVARLHILLELTAPYVKVGGKVLAMKGSAAREELEEAKNAVKKLGLTLEKIVDFPVEEGAHTVLVFKKTGHTPPQYPRRYAKIKQSPL